MITQKTQGSPQNSKDDSTKCCILDAATKLFSKKGMGGTTTREIASLAKVNIASLHYYWDGKDDLLKSVYNKVVDELTLLAQKMFQSVKPDLKETFQAGLGHLFDFFLQNPEYPRIILYGILETPPFLEEQRKKFMVPLLKQVSAHFRQLMEAGVIRHFDPEALLISLNGFLLISFADLKIQEDIMKKSIPDPKVSARFKKQFIETVLLVLGLFPQEDV